MGGTSPPQTNYEGQYFARFNPSTGEQIWQTSTGLANNPNQWIALGRLAILANGFLYGAAGPNVYELNRETGAIVRSAQQTILGMPATDANFDGFQIAPDQTGTILLKAQTRAPGCPVQGNQAQQQCASYGPNPDSTFVAVDPDTLKTIDAILLNQDIVARPIVTKHKGRIYIYMAGTTTLVRVIWDPAKKKLTQDSCGRRRISCPVRLPATPLRSMVTGSSPTRTARPVLCR
jgi:hypothetical protein